MIAWMVLGAAHLGVGTLALWPGMSGSRRLLATTLCLTVPLAGPVLALLVRATRGAGALVVDDEEAESWAAPRPSPDEITMLADLPPIIERLMSPDLGERQLAMLQLIDAGDVESVRLLHWVVEHGAPEVVLEAALALDELDRRKLYDSVSLPI
jgi:hypothetical protein